MNKTLTVSKIVIGASLLVAGIAVFVLSCIGIALAIFFDTFFFLLSLFFVGFALIVTGVFMIVGNAAVLSAVRKAEREAEREAWMRRWFVPPAYGQSAPQGYARPYAPVPPQQPYAPYGAPVQGQMPPRPMPPYGAPAQMPVRPAPPYGAPAQHYAPPAQQHYAPQVRPQPSEAPVPPAVRQTPAQPAPAVPAETAGVTKETPAPSEE